jgi:hypothetical protein
MIRKKCQNTDSNTMVSAGKIENKQICTQPPNKDNNAGPRKPAPLMGDPMIIDNIGNGR